MNIFKIDVRSVDKEALPWKNGTRDEFDVAEFETSEGDEDKDLDSKRFRDE